MAFPLKNLPEIGVCNSRSIILITKNSTFLVIITAGYVVFLVIRIKYKSYFTT